MIAEKDVSPSIFSLGAPTLYRISSNSTVKVTVCFVGSSLMSRGLMKRNTPLFTLTVPFFSEPLLSR